MSLVYAYAALPADRELEELPPGLADFPPEIVSAAGFTLVVQRMPADIAERFEAVQDVEGRAWLTALVVQHERVVEACLSDGPVFPFGFGTLFETRDALAEALAPHATTLESYFARTRGHKEWAVKIYGTVDVPSRRATAGVSSSGRDYLLRRHRAPGERSGAMEAAHREAQDLIGGLADHAANVVAREAGSAPLASSTTTLITNTAFLVNDEQSLKFGEATAAFRAEDWEYLCNLTVSGPWPPYSFRPAIRLGTK